jgi:hypothetical protein
MPVMNVLQPIPLVTAGDMSASITSKVISTRYLNQGSVALLFSGTPTGTFTVESSHDYVPDNEFRTSPPAVGTWQALDLGTTLSATGAAGSLGVDITLSGVPWLRVVYTRTSGTGTLNAYISAKTT